MTKNSVYNRFSERFRAVVEAGGGASAVARATEIPLSSINSYLESTEAPASRAARIAKTCGVSLEWLATGDGPKHQIQHSELALSNEMLDSPANFYLLILSLRSCREYFETLPKPSLRAVLDWIAGPYALHGVIKDYKIELKIPEELVP